MPALKVYDPVLGWTIVPTVGSPGAPGAAGPAGPTGPTGAMGISTVIIGDFGAVQTPAALPPTGLIPVDWDGPGRPAVAYTVSPGESLYYDSPTDPLDGHLFQFVTTTIDPLGWLDIGLIQGPVGPTGPIGVTGPTGPMSDEVWIGPDDPAVPQPNAELWFDTDDTRILGPADLPPAGTTGQALTKIDATSGNVEWTGPYVIAAGVRAHHFYGGPTSAGSTFTWTLAAGTYLCQFQCSCVATATGIRYINFDMQIGGTWVTVGQSKHWFNELSVHHQMNQGVSMLTIPADGDYSCRLSPSASVTMDQNDFGHATLIPCGAAI